MSDVITADTGAVSGVGRQAEHVGRVLGRRAEPVDARLECPLVPEASEFLRALSAARSTHSSCLSSLSSFFSDATSALAGFTAEVDDHECGTSAAWERWRV